MKRKTKKKKYVRLSFALSDKEVRLYKELCKKDGRSLCMEARKALREYFKEELIEHNKKFLIPENQLDLFTKYPPVQTEIRF